MIKHNTQLYLSLFLRILCPPSSISLCLLPVTLHRKLTPMFMKKHCKQRSHLRRQFWRSNTRISTKYEREVPFSCFFFFFFFLRVDRKQQMPISSAVSSPQILASFKLTPLSTNIHYFQTFFLLFLGYHIFIFL